MPKTYSNTYLYREYPNYDKKLFEFVVNAERIDTSSPAFENVAFDIKRKQVSNSLYKILMSKNVVLCIGSEALPKAFKVFVANDVKTKSPKVFIDVTDCIMLKNGEYTCGHIDWIISYLINAMTSFIYRMAPNKLVTNQIIVKDGAECFSKLFSYILDRIYKISTVQLLRQRIQYISALYYQVNILEKDFSKQRDTIKAIALRVSGLEEREAQIVDLQLEENCFLNLNNFVDNINRIFNFKDLKVGMILDKWMQAFGTSTIFGLEFFPAFAAMLTDTYVGGYINQQLTIEKVAGDNMINMSKALLQIGGSVV